MIVSKWKPLPQNQHGEERGLILQGEEADERFTSERFRVIVDVVSHLLGIAHDWIQMGRSGLQLSVHQSRKVEV